MRPIGRLTAAFALAAMSGIAAAEDADSVTATPSRVEAARAAAAEKGEVSRFDEPSVSDGVKDYLKSVHGEVSAMVDSDGGYGVSGTAVLPLGENGTAVITLGQGRSRDWWGVPPDWYDQPRIRRLP